MMPDIEYLKKHWKPPYRLNIYISIFLLLVVNTKLSQAQIESSNETSDDIVLKSESTAYTIRFFLNDNDNYEIVSATCRGAQNVEHVANEDHVCENLNPCSSYSSIVTISNLSAVEPTTFQKTIEAATEYAEPLTTLEEPIPYHDKLNVSWTATNRACVKDFTLEVRSKAQQFVLNYQNNENTTLLDGLDACQDWKIELKTNDINQKLISNRTSTTRTLYAEDDSISITIEPFDNAQIKVSWKSPLYKSCIEQYTLKWYLKGCKTHDDFDSSLEQYAQTEDDGELSTTLETTAMPIEPTTSPPDTEPEPVCAWYANLSDANAKEYVIGKLQGCEDYEFELFINNNTTAKCEPQEFISPEQAPGPSLLSSSLINAVDVALEWSVPQANGKCVQSYEVHVTGPLQKNPVTYTKTTTDTNAFFDNLVPCGNYNFTVVGVSLSGVSGIAMNDTFDTTEAKPTAINNLQVEGGAYDITASWDPPTFGDLCLNGYRLTAWRDESSPVYDTLTNDTKVVVDGLYSCQWYTVQIIPTTRNMDGELQKLETETKAIVAKAPENLERTGVYPKGLELSAQDRDLNNKCETIFARFRCEVTKTVDVPYKSAEQYVEGKVGGISFKALLSPLSPYTDYLCSVELFNIAGWSANRTLLAKTEPYFPDPPENVAKKATTNSSIIYSWSTPKYANGNIKLYITHFQRVKAAYYRPPSCSVISTDPVPSETSSLEQSFTNLQPYTIYSIQIAAQNEYGVGEYTMPFMVKTEPWISDPVDNLKLFAQGPYASVTEYKANVVLSWSAPCKSNGEILAFLLEFTGDRVGHEREMFQRTIAPKFDEQGSIIYNETNLKPEFNYTVTVEIQTLGVQLQGPKITGAFDAPAGIPESLDETEAALAKVDAYEANNPTSSAVVRFPAAILDSESGSILYVALLLSEKHCNPEPQLRFGAINTNLEWPDSRSWNEVNEDDTTDCIYQYQTTPLRWKPDPVRSAPATGLRYSRSADDVEYVIGTENCEQTSKRFCNGPLKPDTEYHLIIRLFTKSGYNDAAMLQFKTDSRIQVTVILISVISCLLLAFIAGFIYLWITKRIVWKRESCQGSIEDSFGDVIGKNFAIFYRDVSKPEKTQREFKELTVVAMDLSYAASELGCNKNRYADIFPYDKNRVILDIDAEGSDYINASFIDGYSRKKEYIATQGPKPESTMDFWRMILQHSVRVIVMVTQFREGDLIKCHEYFPYKSKTINVSVRRKDSFEIYDRTEITLTHDKYGLKQKVIHFYYKKWPDHGCPADPMQLITFVRKVKAEKVPSYSPIVVHCSAGVGRTGTFIGLDIIMQRLKSESKINIFETVKKLRFQRMKMVQTLAQYKFLYACAYELVKHKNTRAVRQYQNNNSKKVSFQDDPEYSSSTLSMPATIGRRNGSDLCSVDELDFENGHSQHGKQGNPKYLEDVVTYDSIPIRFNGYHKSNDRTSLDEHASDADTDSIRDGNTESVM